LGHPSKFERVTRLGFVTAATSLIAGQPNFARHLAISWADTLYIHFWGLLPPDGILPGAKFTLRPSLAFSYIGRITAWPNFPNWYKECCKMSHTTDFSMSLGRFSRNCHTTRCVLKYSIFYIGVHMCPQKNLRGEKVPFLWIFGPKIDILSPAIT